MNFTAIDLFNYNYNKAGNKAATRYIPLFGEGATASSGDLPSGFAVGCLDCYVYAGITLKFRQVLSAALFLLYAC
jgi:hypothetical protein